jgi:uncharacterized membrane protein YqaE (UPF0057 family)
MMYLLAILLPPVAVLLCGKPFQALLNLVLWVLGIIPGIVHAILVVASHQADQRTNRIIRAQRKMHEEQMRAEARRQQHERAGD